MEPAELARNGTEHGEQSALICWAGTDEAQQHYPDAEKIFAINNNAGMGDAKGAMRGARAKMAGVKEGVADLFLPVARHGVHGLFVEMKKLSLRPKRKGGKGGMSDAQIDFRAQVTADGFGYVVCYGWAEAAAVLRQYLS